MGPISSSFSFETGGARLTVKAQFRRPPRYLALRIPYFVRLDSFTSNASRAFAKDNVLYFTPGMTQAQLKWSEIPHAHDHSFQNILKAYRSEFDFIVRDDNYDPKRASKPFLLDDESGHTPEPLSFDLVRRAFHKEYARRYAAYIRAGGKPYPVEAPALLNAEERRAEYRKLMDRVGE